MNFEPRPTPGAGALESGLPSASRGSMSLTNAAPPPATSDVQSSKPFAFVHPPRKSRVPAAPSRAEELYPDGLRGTESIFAVPSALPSVTQMSYSALPEVTNTNRSSSSSRVSAQ